MTGSGLGPFGCLRWQAQHNLYDYGNRPLCLAKSALAIRAQIAGVANTVRLKGERGPDKQVQNVFTHYQ
jgi:hypothetical protein